MWSGLNVARDEVEDLSSIEEVIAEMRARLCKRDVDHILMKSGGRMGESSVSEEAQERGGGGRCR